MQKIILGQTQGHFSTCSSLKIGLNLDRSTCWRERKGAGNKCNAHISLNSNRKCLDRVRDNARRGAGAQVDLFTLSIYTGIFLMRTKIHFKTKRILCYSDGDYYANPQHSGLHFMLL